MVKFRKALGVMTDESPLLHEWMRLNRTWPSDGWDGAAEARAAHDRLVKLVEEDLAADHAINGHGPCINYGVRQVTCICGQPTNGRLADVRQFDRYGNWDA
jgi:hypothetical protein